MIKNDGTKNLINSDKRRCFVIMPFSKTSEIHTEEYWTNHFESYLKPLIESCGKFEVFRSSPLRQDLLKQIINDLVFSPIVVADLTDGNQNVFWELGIRQSFKHGTITIAEADPEGYSKIPFDLSHKGVLFYNINNLKMKANFEKVFKSSIIDCCINPKRPDSIVLETITGRGSVYSVIHREEFLRRVEALISENHINQMIIERIYNAVYSNKEKKFGFFSGKNAVATRLGSSAVDLLLAEHYLEMDSKFYEFINMLSLMIKRINHELSTWDYSTSKAIEKWFLQQETDINVLIKEANEKMENIHKELESSQ